MSTIDTLGRILLILVALGFLLGGICMVSDVVFGKEPGMRWIRTSSALILIPAILLLILVFVYGILSP